MPEGIVVHYFSCANVEDGEAAAFDMRNCRRLFIDLNRPKHEREWYLQDPQWSDERMYASAHVLIGRGGEQWQLVQFNEQAWHAGRSIMRGRSNCNEWTLGVELVGGYETGFTDAQYESLADFVDRAQDQFGISPYYLQGHDEVRRNAIEAGQSAAQKQDPCGAGDNFSWPRLVALLGRSNRAGKSPAESDPRSTA